jgi:DNA-binding CsgD family transcriptional regulator
MRPRRAHARTPVSGSRCAWARLHLCEVALRAGDCAEASRLLDEWAESAEGDLLTTPGYERCRALLATIRGDVRDAERWAADAIARAQAVGTQWDWLEGLRARGTCALLAHDPERAAELLAAVWKHTEREGVDEPGVFPVAPELVEALVETGRGDEARSVTSRLRGLADAQQHPWALATVRRADALAALASPLYDEDAAAQLQRAAGEYAELGLEFDRARALLALGRAQRRRRKWAAARRTFDEAAAVFERNGSGGWADECRSELERLPGRRPRARSELTPAEQRVAELAATGPANKEIARTLFISVHTVEEHLSRAYAKLGIPARARSSRRGSRATRRARRAGRRRRRRSTVRDRRRSSRAAARRASAPHRAPAPGLRCAAATSRRAPRGCSARRRR